MRDEYDPLYKEIGNAEGIDWWLLKAIAQVESSQNWMAYRTEWRFYKRYLEDKPEWMTHRYYDKPQIIASSWGLMQIMYTTAILVGFPREGDWWLLLDPCANIQYGARHFSRLMDRYNGNTSPAVAAYNAGTPRTTSDGKFENQIYCDKVARYVRRFRPEPPTT